MMTLMFQAAAAIVALAAAIMAWRLERRLVRLKSGQDGMQQAAAALTGAVARAEASVRALRAEGAQTAQELEALIARARAAGDELRLIESGGARRPAAAACAPARMDTSFDDMFDDRDAPAARPLPAGLRPANAELMDALRRVR